MKSSTRPIIAILIVVAAAIAFWTQVLGPQRDEADKLAQQVEQLHSSVDRARGELSQALTARRSFPTAYHQLVELGQAVPATDETPSLLVELQTLAQSSGVSFDSIQLEGGGEAAESAATPSPPTEATSSTGTPAAEVVPATEVEASLMPLGASIGTAGLAVMPYSLQFEGDFFEIADFVGKIDSLVRSGAAMKVNGRLVTINGFSLTTGTTGESEDGGAGPPVLSATFSVTTYLTPPGQGITAGASPAAPGPASESTTQTVAAQ